MKRWVRMVTSAMASMTPFAALALAPPPDRVFASGLDLYTLTIDNYISWCSVSVNGGAGSNAASIQQTFPDSTTVTLYAVSEPGFVWGYWTGTDFDQSNGTGTDPNQAAAVTMDADHGVLACCPFSAGMTCP